MNWVVIKTLADMSGLTENAIYAYIKKVFGLKVRWHK